MCWRIIQFSSVRFSPSVVSDSLQPHGLQPARPPCPSPTPGVHSNSRPSSQWCHYYFLIQILASSPQDNKSLYHQRFPLCSETVKESTTSTSLSTKLSPFSITNENNPWKLIALKGQHVFLKVEFSELSLFCPSWILPIWKHSEGVFFSTVIIWILAFWCPHHWPQSGCPRCWGGRKEDQWGYWTYHG